jgi:hypothetical protein
MLAPGENSAKYSCFSPYSTKKVDTFRTAKGERVFTILLYINYKSITKEKIIAMFPKLKERTVELECRDGSIIIAPKLSISEYDELDQVITSVNDKIDGPVNDFSEFNEFISSARKKVTEIVSSHLPEEVREDLWRMSYPETVDLALYLAFGSSITEIKNKAKLDAQKKTA